MSAKDLIDYLERHPIVISNAAVQTRALIIISDNKGGYLQETIKNSSPQLLIIWKSLSGHSTKQIKDYIFHNIHQFVRRYVKILICVWSGTCDVTYRPYKDYPKSETGQRLHQYIALSDVTIENIIQDYKEITSLKSQFVDFAFLEVPYYKTETWNKLKAGIDNENFTQV